MGVLGKFLSPALVLFLLSPMIGELLSSSMPPSEFLNPIGFALVAVLYGGGAILSRELTRRWNKGYLTLLTLGTAYAIIEEGLMVKSFFDPNWGDIGILGSYGRWLGINWIWTVELTVYHAVFSIAIPVLLVELMFPLRRDYSWISNRTFIILSVLLLGDVALGYLVLTVYRPPLPQYLVTIVVVIGLILLAQRMPAKLLTPSPPVSPPRPRWFWLVTFLATTVWFIGTWALPHTGIPPFLTALFSSGIVAVTAWIILKKSGNGNSLSEMHKLALAAGGLSFFIMLTPIEEMDATRPDNTAGMTLVGLIAAVSLIWMARKLKQQVSEVPATTYPYYRKEVEATAETSFCPACGQRVVPKA